MLIESLTYLFGAVLSMLRLLLLDPVNLLLFFLLLLNTFGYVFALIIASKIYHRANDELHTERTNESDLPMVSFIIPAHNEEETIERKLENTYSLNYPSDALDIIVVDDGSTDKTQSILQTLKQTRFRKLKILRQNRKGKSAAENAGLQESKGDIIVISDADVPVNPDALRFMVEDFKNPLVGGVTCAIQAGGKYVLALNLDVAQYARKLENRIDSIFGMSGPFVAFRKSIVSQIDEGIVSSDTDTGIVIRRKGFKVILDSRIVSNVDQWVVGRPKTVIGALKKLKHLSLGSLVLFQRHKGILFRKNYGIFGLLIAPRHLLLNVFASVVFVILSANFVCKVIWNDLFLAFASLLLIFLLTTFLLRRAAPRFIVTQVFYVTFMYVLGYYAQFLYYLSFLLRPNLRRGIWSGIR